MIALPPDPPPIIGIASVIDGDTIEIGGTRVRLWGIDAPDSRQTCTKDDETYPCGQVSATNLADLVQTNSVTCVPKARPERDRRIVATCSVTVPAQGGSGAPTSWSSTYDLGAWQVLSGCAFDWPLYSDGAYQTHEAVAEFNEAGMWAGEFEMPWDWNAN